MPLSKSGYFVHNLDFMDFSLISLAAITTVMLCILALAAESS
jgi:uncharacterized membrane protein